MCSIHRAALLLIALSSSCTALRTVPALPRAAAQPQRLRVSTLRLDEPGVVPIPPPAPPAAPAAPMDPRKAVEKLGSLVQQVQEVWTEGGKWSTEERASRRRQIVTTYVEVFAPAVAFSGIQLALSLSGFLFFLLGLKVSGRGYADLVGLASVLPPLQGLLDQLDDSWGDAAVALLLIELAAPLLLAAALAASPAATAAVEAKLLEWGLDADGLNGRIEKVLDDTTD